MPEVVCAPRFVDERGWFMPLAPTDRASSVESPWVQDNVSMSERGVLRGLHFQHPAGQAKLLTLLEGEIFDVVVDVRLGSPQFGKAASLVLKASAGNQLLIPDGFAHGFYVLSEVALVHYRCSRRWEPAAEKNLLWNDPALGINWPLGGQPKISAKDRAARPLSSFGQAELPLWLEDRIP
jgi:dTDP-4-dehydrorhamnose 3,5-epimerase